MKTFIQQLKENKMDESKEDVVRKETKDHINNVQKFISNITTELTHRGELHDKSKLEEPEFTTFLTYTEKLKGSTYGSDEYKQFLKEMKPALDHHYANNRHHPEHFKNGVDDMNLIDLIELICDWKAATLRHDDGDIKKSIKLNEKRFNLSPQLVKILENSVDIFGESE